MLQSGRIGDFRNREAVDLYSGNLLLFYGSGAGP